MSATNSTLSVSPVSAGVVGDGEVASVSVGSAVPMVSGVGVVEAPAVGAEVAGAEVRAGEGVGVQAGGRVGTMTVGALVCVAAGSGVGVAVAEARLQATRASTLARAQRRPMAVVR
jgi:hypothetical protein